MDVLHEGKVDGFCLVSSDSDFTRLATRIREAGLLVYGFGERKTPEPFVAACDKFVYTEILRQAAEPEKDTAKETTEVVEDVRKLRPLIIAAVDASAREDGWAALGPVGSYIGKTNPAFDARNYGFKKLSELVRSLKYVEIKDQPVAKPDGGSISNLLIRIKRAETVA